MERVGFLCLLLCGFLHMINSETLHQTEKEGNTVALKCGRLTKGPVTWSRDTNGQRVDILTTHNGQTTKHIADPDRRYSSGANLVLIIYGVSQSDAGRYDCSGATVELSVTEETLHVSQKEGNIAVHRCGRLTNGKVTWSRDTNGQRVDILTTHNGEMIKHIADPDRRYSSGANLVLIIYGVSQSDAGRYDCSGATVELSVTEEQTVPPSDRRTTDGTTLPTVTDSADVAPPCKTLHVSQKEGNIAVHRCGRLTNGKVTWSRDTNGQRVDILTTHNGEMIKHIADPDRRYSSGANLVLIIYGVSQSDAGRYDCSGATVELSVTEEQTVPPSDRRTTDGTTLPTVTDSADVAPPCKTLHVSQTEGRIAVLHCGRLTNGKVTWSRDTNGQRVDILTTHNGQTTKHITDPDRRYSSGANLALTIYRVSQSDAGRYDCSGATVELSVTEETLHQTEKEGNTVALKCGRLTKGPVTWSRDTNGQRVDILTTHNGQTTKHITDPDRRYGSQADLALTIFRVSQSDAGRYDCSGATVELSVTSGTETLHQTEKEGNTVALKCGRLTKGPVTWSRDTNGQRVDILTTHNGQTTKHIPDPDRRYDSQADLVLTIRRVSQSDAGRYDCSGATVELSVTEGKCESLYSLQ
ncbi:hypothetical protein SRHO_G00100100 [Serrasalmus rhombeus]